MVPLRANGFQSIIFDGWSMLCAAFRCDVTVVFGTSGCIFLPFFKLIGSKLVLNPDGAEWKRGKWNKYVKSFLLLSEKMGVKYSTHVISDNKHIGEYLEEAYGTQSSLIEYGGDNAKYIELSEEVASKYGIAKNEYAFKVCRIEPENNIDLILHAFEEVSYRLIIIGNWKNSDYGTKLQDKYKDNSNITLLDPIYHQETLDELRGNCGIYVHGHSVGGTNPSLVEAMNLGLFCLVYDVNYNRETTERKAKYFKTKNDLVLAMAEFGSPEFDANSVRGNMLEIANRRYRWGIITNKYAEVFSSACLSK